MNFNVTLVTQKSTELPLNIREAMRYLKIKKLNPPTEELLEDCAKEIYNTSLCRAVYLKSDISVVDNTVDFGFMRVFSKDLAKNLAGCKSAYVFCATLGVGVDRLIEKYSKTNLARATVCDALASAFIDDFCDALQAKLTENVHSHPRFSAGYGDFSLSHQPEILSALDAERRIGVILTDSKMMKPMKTVTAVIGIN